MFFLHDAMTINKNKKFSVKRFKSQFYLFMGSGKSVKRDGKRNERCVEIIIQNLSFNLHRMRKVDWKWVETCNSHNLETINGEKNSMREIGKRNSGFLRNHEFVVCKEKKGLTQYNSWFIWFDFYAITNTKRNLWMFLIYSQHFTDLKLLKFYTPFSISYPIYSCHKF